MIEHELERFAKLHRGGLEVEQEAFDLEAAEGDVEAGSLRVVAFATVLILGYRDDEGTEREGCAVFCESKHRYIHRGILESGIDRLADPDA